MNITKIAKKEWICCFLLNMFFYSLLSLQSYANDLCAGKDANLSCLKKNFEQLYSSNYDLFWDILHKAEKKAQKCVSIQDTSLFLELVHIKTNSAEFEEYFSKIIENLCVSSPKCFLDAVLQLKNEDQIQIVDRLKHTVFVDQSAITEIFKKYKDNKKYAKLIKLYQN